ncbi:MAG: alkaline shock response membrane anchor protein AmaP [Candidatus Bipolaricaulia bacterium]
MDRGIKSYLSEFAYLIAALFLLFNTGWMIALKFDWFDFTTETLATFLTGTGGGITLYLFASISALIGLYSILMIVVLHQQRRRFTESGPVGLIQIAPSAIQRFAQETLLQEMTLSNFVVRVRRGSSGVQLIVNASLSSNQEAISTSARIQKILKARVEGLMGVSVDGVDVIIRRIEKQPQPAVLRNRDKAIETEKPEVLRGMIEAEEEARQGGS